MGCWHFRHIVSAKNDLALKNTSAIIFFLNLGSYLEKGNIKKNYQRRADTLFKQKPRYQTTVNGFALLPTYQNDNPILNDKYVKNNIIVRNFSSFSTLFFVFSKSRPYKISTKHKNILGRSRISIIWTNYLKDKNKFNYLLLRTDGIFQE